MSLAALALASATLTAQPEVTRLNAGQCFAGATGSPAALRSVLPATSSAVSDATASVSESVEFRPTASAATGAYVTANSRVDANTACVATATAVNSPRGVRTVKAAVRPRGYAEADAGAQVYVLAYTSPAACTARCEGTTGYFAWAAAVGVSSAFADWQRIHGGSGVAVAWASPHVRAHADLNTGDEAVSTAGSEFDPYILRGTVKLFDGNVVSSAQVDVSAEPYVYSVALSVGRCVVAGYPNARYAARGLARGTGAAAGYGQLVVPAVGGVVVGAIATSAGRAHFGAKGRIESGAGASPWASATRTHAGAVSASVLASIAGGTAQLDLALPPIQVAAHVDVWAERVVVPAGSTVASAAVTAFNQINDVGYAPRWRTLMLEAYPALIVVGAQPRTVFGSSQNRSVVQASSA